MACSSSSSVRTWSSGWAGCVASQEGEGITQRAPFVDLVFGPQTLHRLPAMIQGLKESGRPQIDISFPEIEKFDRLPQARAAGATAFVSIMEGCSKYCSFCVVPYTRGEEISRPFEQVVEEVEHLAKQGVREITLLGQNVNAYAGPMADGTLADLALLIHFVAGVDGVERIRFTTSHPLEFNDSLIEAYANVPKLNNFLHLPVQSGSDRILAAMKRGHTVLEYKQKLRKLRAVRPDICISTDLIVGFPGETDEDFVATMNLVAEVGFDQSFSFIYSRRPGTPAAALPDEVAREVKLQRLELLQQRLNGQARAISQRMVGSRQRVLVERPAKRNPSSSPAAPTTIAGSISTDPSTIRGLSSIDLRMSSLPRPCRIPFADVCSPKGRCELDSDDTRRFARPGGQCPIGGIVRTP